ncbi:MAG: FAD-binding oxidoreductase [Opitutae bacterium]|nr:FAD-binding oxidoreductase [Opitutae bacterium]
MIDFLIVGHGLAGSALAHMLLKCGQRVVVLDDKSPHSASKVAAGLINPLIGPKFNAPLHAKDCLTESQRFFRSIEKETGTSLYGEFLLHRVFVSEKQRDLWLEKSKAPVFRRYARSVERRKACEKLGLVAPLGAGTQLANRLDFPLFLKLSENMLRQAGCWQEGIFEETDWKEAKKIVFCEGYRVMRNPWFGHLPFSPAQGEILLMETGLSVAASNGTWIVPEKKDRCLAGSTWKHDDLESGPTENGKNKILENLPIPNADTPVIIEHRSGIRPGTRDRSPIMGKHRENARMFLFNGFGSRGAATVPFYSKHMLDFMIGEIPLPKEADLKRFEKNEPLSR